MKEITVKENEAGQRLDKLLAKHLSKAPKSFLYKMLRKKNITLNGKKAAGNEMTVKGDVIRFFLSDETYDKFASYRTFTGYGNPAGKESAARRRQFIKPLEKERILYEDHHILLYNKPQGVLSQKAGPQDVSVNEMLLAYLLETGEITEEELFTFRPAVCNRLDRNTSGLLIAGKTLPALQGMSQALRSRSLHKYYQCLTFGQLKEPKRIEGYLLKNETSNKVSVFMEERKGARPIVTQYTPLWTGEDLTWLEVWLITGRSHQIRAHLASIGHPLVGDEKYGDQKRNRYYREQYHLHGQLLHSARVVMPQMEGELSYLSGKVFTAPVPRLFEEITGGQGYGNMEFQRP